MELEGERITNTENTGNTESRANIGSTGKAGRIAAAERIGSAGHTAVAESIGTAESTVTAERAGNAGCTKTAERTGRVGRATNTECSGKAGRRAAAESKAIAERTGNAGRTAAAEKKANAESAGSAGSTATRERTANTGIAELAEIAENASGGLPREGSRFFANRACEYFPCHAAADPGRFNCLFCYCPLYALGSKCGGNFRWTAKGYKDCTACLFPHQPENYDRVVSRYREIAQLVRQQEGKEGKHLC